MAPDAAAEVAERLVEPLALLGHELQEAVPFGLELTDVLLEPQCVPARRLGLPGELGREVCERVPVLLELETVAASSAWSSAMMCDFRRQRDDRGAADRAGAFSISAATTDAFSVRPATIATAPTDAARQIPAA